MDKKSLFRILKDNPIIPCTNNFNEILESRFDKIKIVLIHENTILDIKELIKKNKEAKKTIILSLEALKGIACDEYGLRFIKEYLNIDMVTASSPKLIKLCKKLGFFTIQTLFILDTKSLKRTVSLAKQSKPHMIEIRPGMAIIKTIEFLKNNLKEFPIICSGLIQNESDIKEILSHDVAGLTTSNKKLWDYFL